MKRVNPNDHWESVYRLAVEIAETTRSPDVRRWAIHIQYLAADGRFGRQVADRTMGRWPPLEVVPDATPPSKKVTL